MNYERLYRLQDRVLEAFSGHFGPFYLTGGTALGRFYLNHRYSNDLDFFTNQDPGFTGAATTLRTILHARFEASNQKIVVSADYIRIWAKGEDDLKIELVNDVAERWGTPLMCGNIPVDTIGNILANKITAVLSREEPKDVFDIVSIASNFSFNWGDVFTHALRKALISEPDFLVRISTFPVELLEGKDWLMQPFDPSRFKARLDTIASDFLLAKDNSLGAGKTPIGEGKPMDN